MTEPASADTSESPPPPPLDLRGHRTLALAAAAVLVVIVGALVAVFGVQRPPAIPRLADQPDPAVQAVLAIQRTEDSRTCLDVVDGQGSTRELSCEAGWWFEQIRWIDDTTLEVQQLRSPDGSGGRIELDVATGEQTYLPGAQPQPGRDPGELDGRRLRTDRSDDEVTLRVEESDGSATELLALESPSGYWLYGAQWSADGSWVAVEDSIGRILVVAGDGTSTEARVWADDVSGIWAIH